jgi:hypothetical protein
MKSRTMAQIVARPLLLVLVLGLGAQHARAQDYVAWVAALEGEGQVLRAAGGDWTALAPSDGLAQGDQVRTLAGGRMKILLGDDSVLSLGESSQLKLDEAITGEAPVSTFQLLFGRIRAIATERYGAAGSRFEVKTPTAIAGVRGTEFFTQHDSDDEETLVVGIVDTTDVRAAIDATGARAIQLGPGQSTRIRRGSYPSPPVVIPTDQLRGLIDATATLGGKGGAAGKKATVQAEPRLPTRPGDREGSPAERVVGEPVNVIKRRGRPAPPPPPPPATRR